MEKIVEFVGFTEAFLCWYEVLACVAAGRALSQTRCLAIAKYFVELRTPLSIKNAGLSRPVYLDITVVGFFGRKRSKRACKAEVEVTGAVELSRKTSRVLAKNRRRSVSRPH